MSAASQKGQKFERSIADHLASAFNADTIDIRVKRGVKDRGDIGGVFMPRGGRVVIECKNHNRVELAEWLKEAEVERSNDDAEIGVVVHKKRGTAKPGEQYVTMTVDSLVRLLGGAV